LYNYADDNTLSYADQDYNILINVLEKESSILIKWLNINCRQANPLSLDKKTKTKNNQYALVHSIVVKLYDKYFLYIYQNLADSLYQYPVILQLHHLIY
jgi:hypothetical protein